jgi:predicted metalloprotease
MRLDDLRESTNIENARGGGRFGGRGIGIGGLGVGGTVVVLLVSMALGIDPRTLLDMGGTVDDGGGPAYEQADPQQQANDPQRRFVAQVLASTEDSWVALFQSAGKRYEQPRLVLYRDAVQSGCGFAEAAVGPFYCPADNRVFLDLSFFQELSQRFHAPGDFAAAYVIAHEVGHHVQNLLGITQRVQSEGRGARQGANSLSVRLELQADCFAGVWAHDADRRSSRAATPTAATPSGRRSCDPRIFGQGDALTLLSCATSARQATGRSASTTDASICRSGIVQ